LRPGENPSKQSPKTQRNLRFSRSFARAQISGMSFSVWSFDLISRFMSIPIPIPITSRGSPDISTMAPGWASWVCARALASSMAGLALIRGLVPAPDRPPDAAL
jgi:hypothetical protein